MKTNRIIQSSGRAIALALLLGGVGVSCGGDGGKGSGATSATAPAASGEVGGAGDEVSTGIVSSYSIPASAVDSPTRDVAADSFAARPVAEYPPPLPPSGVNGDRPERPVPTF